MSRNANKIKALILSNNFDCIESGIDYIIEFYKFGKITLYERNYLINLL